jgi:hypothetical protein
MWILVCGTQSGSLTCCTLGWSAHSMCAPHSPVRGRRDERWPFGTQTKPGYIWSVEGVSWPGQGQQRSQQECQTTTTMLADPHNQPRCQRARPRDNFTDSGAAAGETLTEQQESQIPVGRMPKQHTYCGLASFHAFCLCLPSASACCSCFRWVHRTLYRIHTVLQKSRSSYSLPASCVVPTRYLQLCKQFLANRQRMDDPTNTTFDGSTLLALHCRSRTHDYNI